MKPANLIDGKLCVGEGEEIPVYDPRTDEVMESLAAASEQQVDQAVAGAKSAYKTWGRTTPHERSLVLLKIANRLEETFAEIAQIEARDTGKPLPRVVEDEQHHIVDPFRFFAGACRTLSAPASGEYVAGTLSLARHEPVGVCALIAPWNYPLMMASWKLAPAIAAGNTVVLKPSEDSPLSTVMLVQVLNECLPAGVVQLVQGRGKTIGKHLVEHRDVQLVSLTGDISTGEEILRLSAAGLKRVHLELGGKAPVVVFDDADIDRVADTVASAGFYNAGQDCTAACRVFAQKSVYEKVVQAITQRAEKLCTGKEAGDSADFGPLISRRHLAKVMGYINNAQAGGAKLQCGGKQIDAPGYFVAPTVYADVPFEHEMVQQEIFGPVVTITPFDSDDDVFAMANDTKYGLAASAFTSSPQRILRAQRELEYGCVWVNTHLQWPTEMPHGGYKSSGIGKEMSVLGLQDYLQTKHVMISE